MTRKAMAPATLAMHQAVTHHLDRLAATGPILVGCSGGPDSLSLAVTARAVVDRCADRPVVALIIDHGLQLGSAETAASVGDQLAEHGVASEVVRVEVGAVGGPEAAARAARYAALIAAAERHGAATVLLGHTLDDQAETVLLGLARGSGARSLAGMASTRDRFGRPLLGLRRTVTAAACAELGLCPVTDPHNTDPGYARVRVRHSVLPVLEAELGPGIVEALGRTAGQLRADADLLDTLADQAYPTVTLGDDHDRSVDCAGVAALAPSLRSRVLRRYLLGHGAAEVTAAHLDAVGVLLDDWHGQRWVDLPGIKVVRDHGQLRAVAG